MNINLQIKSSKGFAISQKINQLFLTKYTFKHNYLELKNHIEKQIEPQLAFKLAHADYQEELQTFQLETVRFLHNFIASAFSLVDHTRAFEADLFPKDDSFHAEYQTEVKGTFHESPLAVFIKDLRQYILHCKSPRISTQSNLTDVAEDMKARIVINKNELMEFSGWKSLAKKYIDELTGELDILDTINDYYTLVLSFQSWFEKRQTEIFHKELKELNELRNEGIKEHLVTIVHQFIKSDIISNTFFLSNMTRYFDAEQKKFYDNATLAGKLNYLIFVLQAYKFITTPQEEKIIREKLNY